MILVLFRLLRNRHGFDKVLLRKMTESDPESMTKEIEILNESYKKMSPSMRMSASFDTGVKVAPKLPASPQKLAVNNERTISCKKEDSKASTNKVLTSKKETK